MNLATQFASKIRANFGTDKSGRTRNQDFIHFPSPAFNMKSALPFKDKLPPLAVLRITQEAFRSILKIF
jgi:hypothetical protein